MKKISIKTSFYFVLLFLISCSTMQYDIKKNHKFTEKYVSYLLQKHGNVFYISSTHATFSRVWSYTSDSIIVYRLAKGKTYKVEVFLLKETIQCEALVSENIENELYRQCRRELDGDMFGYRVKIDDKTQYDDYGIDINCLKTKTYKSEALNKIINDINTYKMWEIIYQ